jgi:hypothetical protein
VRLPRGGPFRVVPQPEIQQTLYRDRNRDGPDPAVLADQIGDYPAFVPKT